MSGPLPRRCVTRGSPETSNDGTDAGRQAAWAAASIEPHVDGAAGRQRHAVRQTDKLIGKFYPDRRDQSAFRADFQLIIVARGMMVLAVRLDHREADAFVLELAVAPSRMAQQVRPPDFEPDEVVGVIDDRHLIGFRVAYADSRDRLKGRQHEPRDPGAGRAAFIESLGSGSLPARRTSAPALRTRDQVRETQPSRPR